MGDQKDRVDADGTNSPHRSSEGSVVSTRERVGNEVPMDSESLPLFKETRTKVWSWAEVTAVPAGLGTLPSFTSLSPWLAPKFSVRNSFYICSNK